MNTRTDHSQSASVIHIQLGFLWLFTFSVAQAGVLLLRNKTGSSPKLVVTAGFSIWRLVKIPLLWTALTLLMLSWLHIKHFCQARSKAGFLYTYNQSGSLWVLCLWISLGQIFSPKQLPKIFKKWPGSSLGINQHVSTFILSPRVSFFFRSVAYIVPRPNLNSGIAGKFWDWY